MPILTEISVNRTRATLLFDDRTQLTVRKSDLAACPVQVGDEVDTDAYAGRVCAHQFKDSFDAALSILDYSARTEREIEKKLLAKGFLPDCVSAVLERLRETRLIDDREIALRAVEFASAGKTGIYALKRKLRARGILIRHFNAPRISDYLRITIGTPEQMQRFFAALDEILGE